MLEKNTLFYGDNLDILRRHFPDMCVDLIYLDPPFNSQKNYNILFKEKTGKESKAQVEAFMDTWHWDNTAEKTYLELQKGEGEIRNMVQAFHTLLGKSDMFAYLVMMTIRLAELRRVLKETGSIYLHCDSTANHYLKIVMDKIFGENNFQNEIIWFYKTGGAGKKRFARKHDNIYFYTKTSNYNFNSQKEKSYLSHKYGFSDIIIKEDEKGHYTEVYMRDMWDIPALRGNQPETLGYPTQKPVALLERIIKASSNEGDIVLDPFCGCGTTIAAAQKLNRKWIGIDITHLAITLIKSRLKKLKIYDKDYDIIGVPVDFESAKKLAENDRYQFQYWAGSLLPSFYPIEKSAKNPYGKKGADKGVDGWLTFEDSNHDIQKIVVQVKSGWVGASDIRDLIGTIENTNSVMGVFVTLQEPTEPMKQAAFEAEYYQSKLWDTKFPKIQIITVQQLMNGEKLNLPFTVNK